jgi:adenylate cyclase
LEGSVQKSDGRIRIAAQLIDASTGGHVWAERYDRDGEDIFVIQDEITQRIAAALGSSDGEIEQAARKQVVGRDPNNLTAFELSLRSAEHYHRFTRRDNVIARELNRKAMELKPDWARRYAGEGWTHLADYGFGWSDSPRDSLEQAYEWGKKALELDPNDYESHWLMAYVYLFRKQHDQATASAERALELNPNSAGLLRTIGGAIYPYLGKGTKGVELVKKAMRLDPRHVELWYFDLARAHYQARQYEEVVRALRHISRLELPYRLYLCASLAQSGRTQEARAEVDEILKLKPGASIEFWGEREPYRDAADKEHWIDGLRKAGLPE